MGHATRRGFEIAMAFGVGLALTGALVAAVGIRRKGAPESAPATEPAS